MNPELRMLSYQLRNALFFVATAPAYCPLPSACCLLPAAYLKMTRFKSSKAG
jgi:hypothetical protein